MEALSDILEELDEAEPEWKQYSRNLEKRIIRAREKKLKERREKRG